jgi:hypothetical protein
MELRLRADLAPAALLAQLAPALPEGIRLLAAYRDEPVGLASRLESSRLLVRFDGPTGAELAAHCAALLARESIAVQRERKRQLRTLELRPALRDLRPLAAGEFTAAQALLTEDVAAGRAGEALPAGGVYVELAVQEAALKAAELVELLGGEPESLVALRLGFRLTGEIDDEQEVQPDVRERLRA